MFFCKMYMAMFFFLSVAFFFLSLLFMDLNLELYLEFFLFSINSASIEFIIFLDWMALMFMAFVLFISFLVFNYSLEYMEGEKNMERFILLMVLFVFSMLMMISSVNLVSILLGWDGLGLVSYALVIFYQNVKSFSAGMLTALSNRVGDAALLVGIALFMTMGSWNFLFYLDFKNILVSFFIILAAMTKSAQIPFSSWLPAAMAAPTPVSSLVHSSTLVTAGVYLVIRSVEMCGILLNFLLFSSVFTMLMAGVCANFENDLKKIIALSTLSQLGMMMMILSLGEPLLAFFHLLTHALFKALLFMCAGAIIHNLAGGQDIRFMGGVVNLMPLTCICMNICNFALCGLPFLAGFYSKDMIAELLSMKVVGWLIYLTFYISIGMTTSYSLRLSYYIFYGDQNFSSLSYFTDKNNKQMNFSMLGLVFFVIFKGSILSWIFFSTPYFIILPPYMKYMAFICILSGAALGYELSTFKSFYLSGTQRIYQIVFFFSSMWNMPVLSTFGVNNYFLSMGKQYFKNLDQGWFEYYGAKGLAYLLYSLSSKLQNLSSSPFKLFLLTIFFFFVSLWIF
uniref:NADH-ubiquinone oxidoreductase chain 5 n=1 Tax=Polygraphus poligraphus TaxID=516982 RepID=A0A8F4WD56_9CUCU|nr:NADH dehydrogenase subunit 5 [Polygraphus poligraphus]QXG82905.1 NADH dehydrogenase subunit 5 [Polygraphus poligraphus]UJX85655.1 NADH dehydrogenase subunit 5 [Polygraphus poligraphus]